MLGLDNIHFFGLAMLVSGLDSSILMKIVKYRYMVQINNEWSIVGKVC